MVEKHEKQDLFSDFKTLLSVSFFTFSFKEGMFPVVSSSVLFFVHSTVAKEVRSKVNKQEK